MRTTPLQTANPLVSLVEPDVEHDAVLGVKWLEGDAGRESLRLMGVADADNVSTSLEAEKTRVVGFINREDQLNWMIMFNGEVVGSVWVDLQPSENLSAPSIHIMIGDPSVRGKGIGSASFQAVIDHLKQQGTDRIYSRHLIDNVPVTNLFNKLGFTDDGEVYTDADGFVWQNVLKEQF